MATKINTDYYGAEADFYSLSNYFKRSPYNLYNLFESGTYTGGALDVSAAPWGIGKSSASSDMEFIAAKGAEWTIHRIEQSRGNTPLYFYQNSSNTMGAHSTADFIGYDATESNYKKALYKARISPEAHNSGYDVISDLAADSGDSVTLASVLYNYPITYADYQGLRVYIHHVYYKPEGEQTIRLCSMSDILNDNVSVDKIVYFDIEIYNKAGSISTVYCSIGGNALQTPELFKTAYYGDSETYVRPWRYIDRYGDWYIPSFESSIGFRISNSSASSDQGDWEDGDPNISPEGTYNGWTHASTASQTFGELSYHWEYGISPYSSDQWDIDPVETGTTYASGVYRMYCYMEIDNEPDDKNEAYFEAILHEVAFLGLPIIISLSDLSEEIGSDNVYLPVFDDHMITTGEFMSGADSLNLNNSTWEDIFSDTMPAYDPDYEPEPPEPGEDDQGDLTNSYSNRYTSAGGLTQYVVSRSALNQLSAFLNGTYLPTAAELDADFKGTNPIDYIISVQKYPFTLPNSGVDNDIYIGKNNTSIKGRILYNGSGILPINTDSTYDFGTLSIPFYYNDFRDYQSKIYLFMPFIGTDELDPRLYIGHNVSLIYRVDYNTGSVVAEIKRDGLTMETKNSTISITVPFLAANMGAYQNQLAQLSYSKDMTKIKGIGTALSAGFTMAAGASGALSTGQPSLAAGSNLVQAGVSLAANATQLNYIDYQIEHTAPQIGTISTAGAGTAFFMDDRARIVIMRPKMLAGYNAQQYSRTVGNACCKTGKLSSFSGYTQAATAILDNVHTKHISRQATEQEKQLLRRALQNGIYL